MSQPEHGWFVLLFSLFVAVWSASCGGTATSDNEDPKAHETVLARIQTTQTAIFRLTPTATLKAPEPTAWPLGTIESTVVRCNNQGELESACRCLAEGLHSSGVSMRQLEALDAVAFRPGPSGFHLDLLLAYMLETDDPFVDPLYEGDPNVMQQALQTASVCREERDTFGYRDPEFIERECQREARSSTTFISQSDVREVDWNDDWLWQEGDGTVTVGTGVAALEDGSTVAIECRFDNSRLDFHNEEDAFYYAKFFFDIREDFAN